jgi:small-conductance mechanosensitive channel
MDDPESWTRAAKDFLTWGEGYLPVTLGTVLMGGLIVLAAVVIIRAWRGK